MIKGLKFEYTNGGIFFDTKVQMTPGYVDEDKVYTIEEKVKFHFDCLNKLKVDHDKFHLLEKINDIKPANSLFKEIQLKNIVLNFYTAKVGTHNSNGKDYMVITQTHNKNKGWENTKVFYTAFEFKEKANEFLKLVKNGFKDLTNKNFENYFNNLNNTYEVL